VAGEIAGGRRKRKDVLDLTVVKRKENVPVPNRDGKKRIPKMARGEPSWSHNIVTKD